MSDSDKLAIAAHLHVLLRRKTGRVTDTEWMAANADYAQEIVRFARQRATEDNAPDLAEWADRLEQALHASPPAAAPADADAVRHLGTAGKVLVDRFLRPSGHGAAARRPRVTPRAARADVGVDDVVADA